MLAAVHDIGGILIYFLLAWVFLRHLAG
jgi:Mg/Co/Ni transporter MgtE